MSQITQLKNAKTFEDIAKILGCKASSLSFILYKTDDNKKYKKFKIPKKNGGFREICSPCEKLLTLQKKISFILQNCLEEIAIEYERKSNKNDRISHGFRKNRSIVTNAVQHKNRRFVFNLDLENFFGSITFARVRGFFLKNRNFELTPKTATVIAQIACFDNCLPQGSPSSPVISNLLANILDIHLSRLAAKEGCTYTRYADDLTFSTNKPNFPERIAIKVKDDPNSWTVGKELDHLIEHCKFSINHAKTRMQYQDSRQEVTGLVVNKKVNVRSDYRHNVRAMVQTLFTTGSFYLYKKNKEGVMEKTQGDIKQLHGMLGFIDTIDRYNKNKEEKKTLPNNKSELKSKELVYRRFLMYKEFYTADLPVIICEGKTDNIYLTQAIRANIRNYPDLAQAKEDNIEIKVRRFRYTDTSTGRILGIHSGGGPNLGKFIRDYKNDSELFKAPGLRNPIIVLIDNDSGASKVFSVLKEITGKSVSSTADYIHVFKNMYVIPTPLLDGRKESVIEDFFEPALLKEKYLDKPLDLSNSYNKRTHYGKADFAYQIVQKKSDKIDFSGFKPLLDRIVSVINLHREKFLVVD